MLYNFIIPFNSRSAILRYRDRFWRESTFKGVELIKRTLDEVYGEDQVSLVSAALRWMNHHSYMTDKGKLGITLLLLLQECGSQDYDFIILQMA